MIKEGFYYDHESKKNDHPVSDNDTSCRYACPCGLYNNPFKPDEQTTESTPAVKEPAEIKTVAMHNFSTEMHNSPAMLLSLSNVTTLAANQSVSKTLTATVLPADAANKEVDWIVEWSINPFGANVPVTDYLTVIPESDGSNVATVTAHKGFDGATTIITGNHTSGRIYRTMFGWLRWRTRKYVYHL